MIDSMLSQFNIVAPQYDLVPTLRCVCVCIRGVGSIGILGGEADSSIVVSYI